MENELVLAALSPMTTHTAANKLPNLRGETVFYYWK